MTAGILLGAGLGRRMGEETPKVFIEVGGRPVAYYAIKLLAEMEEIDTIIFAVPPGWKEKAEEITAGWGFAKVTVVEGGTNRQDSVHIALHALPPETRMVVIHDGARPNASAELFRAVIAGAKEHGACVPALASEETVKLVRGGRVVESLNRDEIHIIQTPQAFYRDVILQAHELASERKWRVTDDSTLVERMGRPVSVIPGERSNIKITHTEDIGIAELLLRDKNN